MHDITTVLAQTTYNTKVKVDIVTLTRNYEAIVCVCGSCTGVYTDPTFKTSNSNSHIIRSRSGTYAYPSSNTPTFSTHASIDGTNIFSSDYQGTGTSVGSATVVILGCKAGDVISFDPQSTYGGQFSGKVGIIGIN